MTQYHAVIGNREYIKINGDRRPFWEFLDMQFDAEEEAFVFVPHYNLRPNGLERFTHLNQGD